MVNGRQVICNDDKASGYAHQQFQWIEAGIIEVIQMVKDKHIEL